MSRNKIFKNLKEDYRNAKKNKISIDADIDEWNDLYFGDNDGRDSYKHRHNKNKSKMKMLEIAKQIEFQKPNIIEPFLSTDKPINVTTQMSEKREHIIEKWLNYNFVAEMDRLSFLEQAVDTMLREGTVWAQTSWDNEEEIKIKKIENISTQEIIELNLNPSKVIERDNGRFDIEITEKKIIKNKPSVDILRNEYALPDPSARTKEELNYFCRIRFWSYEDMKNNAIIDNEKLEELLSKIEEDETEYSDYDKRRNGSLEKYQSSNKKLKKIKVIEYWGKSELPSEENIDEEDDTINEQSEIKQIVAFWAVKEDLLLGIEENPFPDKSIPFDGTVYSYQAFSLWGKPPAFFLGDNQRLKTGMMRGIVDNLSLANNGQKFITKNTMDYVNYKRMINGEKYIYVNRQDGIKDGTYNNVPASVFNLIDMLSTESKSLTGTNPNQAGTSSAKLDKNQQSGNLTIAEKKNISLVRNMSHFLSNIFKKWVNMAEVFLEDEQILELFTEEEIKDINAFSGIQKAKVSVSVGTEESKNAKMNSMNMLMQQARVLEKNLPPGILNSLVGEMYDMFNMPEKARAIKEYVPEPSQQEIEASQLELTKMRLENNRLMVETQTLQKDVEAKYMNAQARMMEAMDGSRYKDAQIEEKKAKARKHDIESAIKPITEKSKIEKENKQQKGNDIYG